MSPANTDKRKVGTVKVGANRIAHVYVVRRKRKTTRRGAR